MTIDCGIDIGSTNVKVVLVDESGRMVHVRSVPTPRASDGLGSVTNALELVSLLEDMIIEGWQQNAGGKPLRSITTAGVGEDGLGVDAALRPTGPAIPWFDRRAKGEIAALRTRGDFTSRTGIAIASDRTIAKWAWIRRFRPQELEEAKHWIALADYPAVWWSGRPFMSISLAPRTACFDLGARKWIDELTSAAGAPPMPEIVEAGVSLGGVREGRLRQSGAASTATIVAVGGHDHPVAASIVRRDDPNATVDSMGTANLLYGELVGAGRLPCHPQLAFSIPPAGGASIACLGVVELSMALASSRAQGDAFWSFLAQPHLPGDPPQGLADLAEPGAHAREPRRALEHASLAARSLLVAMSAAGVSRSKIYSSGGWSRSRGFIELRASIFGEPIHVVDDIELTAVGAALFGAQAAGADSASPLNSADIKTIEPVADWVPVYDKLFAELQNERVRVLRNDGQDICIVG